MTGMIHVPFMPVVLVCSMCLVPFMPVMLVCINRLVHIMHRVLSRTALLGMLMLGSVHFFLVVVSFGMVFHAVALFSFIR
jgi:hypothetical protein